MSRREESKQLKREKIIATARDIISKEGLDKLTMRYLADKACVSSRTPYNLFESKTDILVAIVFDATRKLPSQPNTSTCMFVEQLILLPKLFELFCTKEHDFYRDVLWGIISSDDRISRDRASSVIGDLVGPLVIGAADKKELSGELSIKVLNSHLVTQFLAIIGMWAGSQLALDEAVANIQFSWINTLLPYAKRKGKTWLSQAHLDYGQVLEKNLAV
jgi:hypothetical protein